jgi:diguanylate cyclase (GGDEF)-like protein
MRAQFFLLGLLLAMVLGMVGWDAWRDHAIDVDQLPLISRMHEVAAESAELHGLLVVTARLALADGTTESDVAYRQVRRRLFGLVELAARDYAPAARGIARTRAANMALAAVHDRAFALARTGHRIEAQRMLRGREHEARRLTAVAENDAFRRDLEVAGAALRAELELDRRFDDIMAVASIVVLAATLLFGLLLTRRWKRALDKGGVLVRNKSLQLEQLNDALEARVLERTRELGESTLASLNMMEDAVDEREAAARAHEKLDYLAYYDALTGLARRGLFLERVAQFERGAAGSGHKVALLLMDLERFRNVNDSLGREGGDDLLKKVAGWLTVTVGDANLVAHLGADHFAIVLPEVKLDSQVAHLVESLIGTLAGHHFLLSGVEYRVTAKFGVALYPDDGEGAAVLFEHAEAALKKAKSGGDPYLFYTQKLMQAVAGRLTLENDLRRALDKGEFVLHYQPKVNLRSGLVTGAEALIRWNDPRTGLVPPGKFIPVLEDTGLISEVGKWALRQALDDYLRWHAAGLAPVRIAVNVSPLQLRQRDFITAIEALVGTDPVAARALELEITEGMIMHDLDGGIATLQVIRALGLTVAIDDFGTGFSSLAYLSKLPIDTLKIDRSFVNEIALSPDGMSLVSTIINLAHSLKLNVVAEGVETDEQKRLLALLACDEMQGFLFSKAVPAEAFEAAFLAPRARAESASAA